MASANLPKNLLWADVVKDDSIETFEHPLTEMTLTKQQFHDTFGAVLDLLDGSDMSAYVDFFFERNPVQQTHLKYVGEDEKQDFLDWAIEEGCMPSVKEVSQGEDDAVRKERLAAQRQEAADKKAKAAADAVAREVQLRKLEEKRAAAAANPAPKEAKQLQNRLKGLDALRNKKKPNPDKIARAEEALAAQVAKYVAAYPDQLHLLPLQLVPEEHRAAAQAAQEAAAAEGGSAAGAAASGGGKKGGKGGQHSTSAGGQAAAEEAGTADEGGSDAPEGPPAEVEVMPQEMLDQLFGRSEEPAAAPAQPKGYTGGIAMDSDSESDSDSSSSDSDGSSSDED